MNGAGKQRSGLYELDIGVPGRAVGVGLGLGVGEAPDEVVEADGPLDVRGVEVLQ